MLLPFSPFTRRFSIAAVAAVALTLTACSAPASPDETSGNASGHGFVEGASENPEPQLQLAVVGADGSVHLNDLLTGESSRLGELGASPDAVATDGRLLAVTTGASTTLVDSGTWTVDHGDHAHYYRAQARILDPLETGGPVGIESSERLTVLFSPATGRTTVLDRDALAQGRVEEVGSIETEPHDGVALPLGRVVVASTASEEGASDEIGVFDPDGTPSDRTEPCEDARGGAVTRVGAVIGCADGAVLATVDDEGVVSFERIPYPAGTGSDLRATDFAQRPGRPSVAAVAGTSGAWVLDTRARTWQLLPTPTPLLTAVAADDDRDLVVALDTTGAVIVIRPETGETWSTPPLTADPANATLHVDASRAYLNDPGGTSVHEIDYADSARVARSLEMPVAPRFFAETGR